MEEIYSQLDKLQRFLESRFKIPMTEIIVINQDEVLDLISEIQESIPKEIQESVNIRKEENALLEKAEKQSQDIDKYAKTMRINKIKGDPDVQRITGKIKQVIQEARQTEENEIKEIKDYAGDILNTIQGTIEANLKYVIETRKLLRQRKVSPHVIEIEEEYEEEEIEEEEYEEEEIEEEVPDIED
jgi:hypothetical protein